MSLVLVDAFPHEGSVVGGILGLAADAPEECFVNHADPPEGWMWPDDAARRVATIALVRSLVAALDAPPTLLVCPESCADAVREAAPYVPLRTVGEGARWVGTAPFAAHPAARLAEGLDAAPWLARLRRGILIEARTLG